MLNFESVEFCDLTWMWNFFFNVHLGHSSVNYDRLDEAGAKTHGHGGENSIRMDFEADCAGAVTIRTPCDGECRHQFRPFSVPTR